MRGEWVRGLGLPFLFVLGACGTCDCVWVAVVWVC